MKKTLVALMCAALIVMVGCAGVQFTPNVEKVALKSVARVAGYKLAEAQPGIASAAYPVAISLVNVKDDKQLVEVLWPMAIAQLTNAVGKDPLLAATLADCVGLVQVDVAVAEGQTKMAENIRIASIGFAEGVTLFQSKR